MTEKELSTAETLCKFYKELQDGGMHADDAFVLVQHASKFLLNDAEGSLRVKA